MLLQPLYRVVIIPKLCFSKHCMYLIVAYLMQQDGGCVFTSLAKGYQVVFGTWLCKFAFAEGA